MSIIFAIACSQYSIVLQDSAERLCQDTIRYESLGLIVETAKKIASMCMKMAQLIRSELRISTRII